MELIALAGLPGSGKSALARELARRLACPRLGKDELRAALFAPELLEYSAEQDELVMRVLYELADWHLRLRARRQVLLDGRTHSRRAQVDALEREAALRGWRTHWIECRCARATARTRLERDRALGLHAAGNRDFALYERLERSADALVVPRLVLDTDARAPQELALEAHAWLAARGAALAPDG